MNIKENIKIIIWSIVTSWKINPKVAFIKFFSNVINQFTPILSALYISNLLNKLTDINSITNEVILSLLAQFLLLQLYILVGQQLSDVSTVSFTNAGNWALERNLYIALNKLPLEVVEKPEFANQYMRAQEARMKILEAFNKIVDISGLIIRIISIIIMVFPYLPWQVTLLMLTLFPRFYFVGKAVKKVLQYTIGETENRKKFDMISWNIKSVVNQIEVRLISAFSFLDNITSKYWRSYYKKESDLHSRRSVIASILAYTNILIIAWGLYELFNGYINSYYTLGFVTFCLTNLQTLSGSINGIVGVSTALIEMNKKCFDYKLIIDLQDKYSFSKEVIEDEFFKNSLNVKLNEIIPPKIEINSVSFTYPNSDRQVLKNINLEIKPKEKIAIVGHNGAGKTTLIKLLLKLYRVNEGEIKINDILIDQIPNNIWYENYISCLMQNFNTYNGLSIKDNVYISNSTKPINEKDIENKLDGAELLTDINNLQNGINTLLSTNIKGGTNLSVGQLQKLAIARFLYTDSSIAIFDEPTASIDPISEKKIFDNIFSSLNEKTVIIISHRFSTVRKADRIIVIDNGEIIESGSHMELMEKKGLYFNAFEAQAEGYK